MKGKLYDLSLLQKSMKLPSNLSFLNPPASLPHPPPPSLHSYQPWSKHSGRFTHTLTAFVRSEATIWKSQTEKCGALLHAYTNVCECVWVCVVHPGSLRLDYQYKSISGIHSGKRLMIVFISVVNSVVFDLVFVSNLQWTFSSLCLHSVSEQDKRTLWVQLSWL